MYLLMDKAYEDWETRLLAFEWGYRLVVPPKKNERIPGNMIRGCINNGTR
jgi:hypothetical protein